VDECPDALLVKNEEGCRPRHLFSVRKRVPLEVVRCLAETRPDALLVKDEKGWLPLPVEVIRCLAVQCSTALRVKNKEGYRPLHISTRRWRWSDASRICALMPC
jgi:hypothetical protein